MEGNGTEMPLPLRVAGLDRRVTRLEDQLPILLALAETTAARVARLSDERVSYSEVIAVREEAVPSSDDHRGFRKKLESLSDEIEDTKKTLIHQQAQTAAQKELAELRTQLAVLNAAQGWRVQRWQAAIALATIIAGLVAALWGGRATAPPNPTPMPYPVNIPTAGVHP